MFHRFVIPEIEKRSEDIQRNVCDMLKEHINVRWKIVSNITSKAGRVLLDNIHLSDKMIENLELLPTTWDIFINNIHVDNLVDNANLSVGEPIKVKLNLQSGFEHPFRGQICVEFYVHDKRTNVSDSCVITQKESRLQICNPGSIIEHSTIILPLMVGKFEIECSCKIQPGTSNNSGNIFSNVSKHPPITVIVK